MFASLRRRVPRLGRLPRLCAIGICLLLALNSAMAGKDAPADQPSSAVVVAARDLPAGHVLGRGDVRVARWPPALKPADAAADPGNVVGRRLTGPVTDREPVTANRLLGTALTRGLRAGLVAAPVGIDDPHVAELVHPGERVDLLATRRPPEIGDASASDPGAVTTVAHSALVLAAFAGRDGAGSEVVLAVDRAVAVTITRDSRTDVFTVVAGPP